MTLLNNGHRNHAVHHGQFCWTMQINYPDQKSERASYLSAILLAQMCATLQTYPKEFSWQLQYGQDSGSKPVNTTLGLKQLEQLFSTENIIHLREINGQYLLTEEDNPLHESGQLAQSVNPQAPAKFTHQSDSGGSSAHTQEL